MQDVAAKTQVFQPLSFLYMDDINYVLESSG